MAAWTEEELTKIGRAEELRIETLRRDGSLRDPVTIWVVRYGDSLFVRAVYGRTSAWFKGALGRHAGRIQAGGIVKAVDLVEEADPAIQAAIDGVYRSKYRRYAGPIVDSTVTSEARAATLKLVPQ